MRKLLTLLVLAPLLSVAQSAERYCGETGVWVQTLGSGELDLEHKRSAPSYLVWENDVARVLVDAGAGTSLRFSESNARFTDLHAILLSQTSVEHTGDLASLLVGAQRSERDATLPILGPEGEERYLSTSQLIQRLFGNQGVYPEYAFYSSYPNPLGFRVRIKDIPTKGRQEWTGFGTTDIQVYSVPVAHGARPTIAWRVHIGDRIVVFANDFSNQKDTIASFAKSADLLVVSHVLPAGATASEQNEYAIPSQIGRVATRSEVRFVLLGSRSWRTFGRENNTTEAIEEHFSGPLIFANELECWGL